MTKLREIKSSEEKEFDREEARIGMIISRKNEAEEIREYNRIKNKYKKREQRKFISKEKLLDMKEKSKEGMSFLRREGRLRKKKDRSKKNMNELSEFREYVASSKENLDHLERVEPDVVQKIKKKGWKKEKKWKDSKRWTVLLAKGKKRNREEEEEYQTMHQKIHEDSQKRWRESLMKAIKALDREHLKEEIEYWFEYHKLATTEPTREWLDLRYKITEDYNCLDPKYVQKKKEEEDYRKWWKKKHAQIVAEWEEREGNHNVTAKKIENESVEDKDFVVKAPKELSEYEKLREKNIKERKEAMAKSNFFEELKDCKLEIGLHKS